MQEGPPGGWARLLPAPRAWGALGSQDRGPGLGPLGVSGDGTCEVRACGVRGPAQGFPVPAVGWRVCGFGSLPAAPSLGVASRPKAPLPKYGCPWCRGPARRGGRGLPWAQGVCALAVQAVAGTDGEPEEGAEQRGVHLGGSSPCASSSRAGGTASPGSRPSGEGRKAGTPSAQAGSPGSAQCRALSRAARPRPSSGGGDSAGRVGRWGRGRGHTMDARPAPVRADVMCLCVLRKLLMACRQSWAEGSVRPPALPGPPCRGVDQHATRGRGCGTPRNNHAELWERHCKLARWSRAE